MSKYRITVDREICISCGIAPSTCSLVFLLGEDNGKNRVSETYSENTSDAKSVGIVTDDLYDCVMQAADACPVQAIKIEEV